MAFNLFKAEVATGVLVGVAVAALVPVVLPAIAVALRPLAKEAIKGGLIFYEKSQEWVAELGETVDDLIAEARAELDQEGHLDVFTATGQGTAEPEASAKE